MKVLIVDDEPLAVERLSDMVESIEGHGVAGTASNGVEALEMTQTLEPDVLLLDVQMPAMDGIETARHLVEMDNPPSVIFCTAYDEYALEAFDARAIAYLVKPVRQEKLEDALARAHELKLGREQLAELESSARSHLCARIRGNLELVPIENIVFLMAEHKYVTVYYDGGETLIEEPLIALEEEFGERFLRIHRNALVARDRITGLKRSEDGNQVVNLRGTDRQLEVSRRNLPNVRKVLRNL